MSVITDQKIERVTFFEITKNAILKAMESPRDVNRLKLIIFKIIKFKLD